MGYFALDRWEQLRDRAMTSAIIIHSPRPHPIFSTEGECSSVWWGIHNHFPWFIYIRMFVGSLLLFVD